MLSGIGDASQLEVTKSSSLMGPVQTMRKASAGFSFEVINNQNKLFEQNDRTFDKNERQPKEWDDDDDKSND